ncbi:hypothetical protein AB0K43_07575 [Kitasatospora sp. NPDC049258]|uniref:HAAS signaling domain-containing protein n=1 Tax=Kitasatospora sp. NPDC049258 TaxID=3155394 RepID=UPI0034432B00
MNDTLTHPLVRAYLSAVEERGAALPEDRRRELLADLSEHIEVALADAGAAGTVGEEAVREVLGRLGAPGDIAAAALAEEPGGELPAPAAGGRTAVTLGLVVAPLPLAVVPAIGGVLSLAATIAALVLLWKSPQWVRREKRQATLLVLSPVVTLPVLALVCSAALGGLSPAALLSALPVALCLPVAAAVRLGRSAARLRRASAL